MERVSPEGVAPKCVVAHDLSFARNMLCLTAASSMFRRPLDRELICAHAMGKEAESSIEACCACGPERRRRMFQIQPSPFQPNLATCHTISRSSATEPIDNNRFDQILRIAPRARVCLRSSRKAVRPECGRRRLCTRARFRREYRSSSSSRSGH